MWRLQNRGGACWWMTKLGGDAPLRQGFLCDGVGRNTCQFGPDTVSPSSDTILSWRASWESGVHCTLHTRGNPRTYQVWAAAPCRWCSPSWRCCLVRNVSGCLKRSGQKTEGAAFAGHHRFVTSPLLLFLFFLGMVLLLFQHFFVSNYCIDVVVILI
jgi:hypothetical protein